MANCALLNDAEAFHSWLFELCKCVPFLTGPVDKQQGRSGTTAPGPASWASAPGTGGLLPCDKMPSSSVVCVVECEDTCAVSSPKRKG